MSYSVITSLGACELTIQAEQMSTPEPVCRHPFVIHPIAKLALQ